MTKKLRVIFQGGGARVATLLAAADAIERRCKAADIEIVEVAGVSAGSIAAAALACVHSVSEITKRLRSQSTQFLALFEENTDAFKQLSEMDIPGALKDLQDFKLADIWNSKKRQKVSELLPIAELATKLIEGNPIVPEKEIEQFLLSAFNDGEGPLNFSELGCLLTVFSSDLENSRPVTYGHRDDRDPPSNAPVHQAVAKSISMPILFSNFGSGSETDGGITGNLPGSFFLDDDDEGVKTLAIAFEPEDREVKDFVSFGLGLLSTALDSAVRESKMQIEESGGVVLELENQVSTYDFRKAIEQELQNDRFDKASRQIEEQVRETLTQLFAHSYHVVRRTKFGNDQIATIFEQIYSAFPAIKTEATKLMIDGRAKTRDAGDNTPPDSRVYTDYFEPRKDALLACQIGLPFNLKEIRLLTVKVQNSKREDIAFRAYLHEAMLDPSIEKKRHRVLIFLEKPQKCRLTVSVRFDGVVFDKIVSEGRDWDFFRTHVVLSEDVKKHTWYCVLKPGSEIGAIDIRKAPQALLEQMCRDTKENGGGVKRPHFFRRAIA